MNERDKITANHLSRQADLLQLVPERAVGA